MIHVAFVHGLEGHANGSKVVSLREQGFRVSSAEMGMSLWSLRRENSMARHLLRLGEPRWALGLGLAAVAASVARGSALGVGASVSSLAAWANWRRRRWVQQALGRSFDACVEIQAKAVREAAPDVLVGSSWGGAVAAQLLLDGVFAGPTILLAPAIARVRSWTCREASGADERLRELSRQQPLVIFHDPSDETVPHADSVALAAGSQIDLRSVTAGGHRLMDLVEGGELAAAIRELTTAA